MTEISKNFTVDDIRAVRERNYEATKDLTEAEREAYYKTRADAFLNGAGIVPKNRRSVSIPA